METHNEKFTDSSNAQLTEQELQKINEEVDKVVSMMKEINDTSDKFRIEWQVASQNESPIKSYRQFLLMSDKNEYRQAMEIESFICLEVESSTFWMTIVIGDFSHDDPEIKEITKFICDSAKSYDCYFQSIGLDIVFSDDERCEYDD